MERTIKFRGKRKEDNKWIYGCLADSDYINNINEIATPSEEIDPDTVGQFIGIKDSNGEEIYEGDIFTVNGLYPKVVAFIEERASFCIANIDELNDYPVLYPWQFPAEDWWNDFNREIVVVGNVFESKYKHLQKYIK